MFQAALVLWLKSHGLTDDECGQVCAHRHVDFSVKLQDAGGMLADLPRALYGLRSTAGGVAASALHDPSEQLLLMQHLRNAVEPKRDAAPATTQSAPVEADRTTLRDRICREMELTRGEYKLLTRLFA